MNTFRCSNCGFQIQRPTQPFSCPQCGRQAVGLFRVVAFTPPQQGGWPAAAVPPQQPMMPQQPAMPQQPGWPQPPYPQTGAQPGRSWGCRSRGCPSRVHNRRYTAVGRASRVVPPQQPQPPQPGMPQQGGWPMPAPHQPAMNPWGQPPATPQMPQPSRAAGPVNRIRKRVPSHRRACRRNPTRMIRRAGRAACSNGRVVNGRRNRACHRHFRSHDACASVRWASRAFRRRSSRRVIRSRRHRPRAATTRSRATTAQPAVPPRPAALPPPSKPQNVAGRTAFPSPPGVAKRPAPPAATKPPESPDAGSVPHSQRRRRARHLRRTEARARRSSAASTIADFSRPELGTVQSRLTEPRTSSAAPPRPPKPPAEATPPRPSTSPQTPSAPRPRPAAVAPKPVQRPKTPRPERLVWSFPEDLLPEEQAIPLRNAPGGRCRRPRLPPVPATASWPWSKKTRSRSCSGNT